MEKEYAIFYGLNLESVQSSQQTFTRAQHVCMLITYNSDDYYQGVMPCKAGTVTTPK